MRRKTRRKERKKRNRTYHEVQAMRNYRAGDYLKEKDKLLQIIAINLVAHLVRLSLGLTVAMPTKMQCHSGGSDSIGNDAIFIHDMDILADTGL